MAFEWNWKGSQNAYDAYKTAEDLASQRYWANRDYIDAQNQAIAAQNAALGARVPVIYNNMSQPTNGMVNPYGPLFNPSAASVDEIKAMQSQIGTKADGSWGKKSQKAYNKYMQNMIGVTADGVWGPKSQAAYDNAAYNPAELAYQEAAANAKIAYEAQQAQAQQDALRAELAQNEQRIAQIKLEIAQLKGESGRAWDNLDMQLAANRANAGDIGNAVAHQNRIITRQQLAAANGGKTAADKEAEVLVEEFIKTQSMMMMGDNSQRPGYQNMLNFLGDKIQKNPKAKKMLEQFQGKYGANTNSNKTYQDFENFVSGLRTANANNKIKKNGLTQADKKRVDEYWYSLPQEVRDAHEKEYNDIRGEEDIESIQSRGAKKLAKQKAALAEAKQNIRKTDLDKSGSYTYTASNGETVDVKRSKYGNAVFSIGKLVDTVAY